MIPRHPLGRVLGQGRSCNPQSAARRGQGVRLRRHRGFGITPVEAQAAGTPVIALEAGGLRETIKGTDHVEPTSLFFGTQDVEAIIDAVERFEQREASFDLRACRVHAEPFGSERFRLAFRGLVDRTVSAISLDGRVLTLAPADPRLLGATAFEAALIAKWQEVEIGPWQRHPS